MRSGLRSLIYLLAGLILLGLAYLLYPLFGPQGYKGFEADPPNIVVYSNGALGAVAPGVEVDATGAAGQVALVIDQPDVSERTAPGATIAVAMEQPGHGYEYSLTPLHCSASVADGQLPIETTVAPGPLWAAAAKAGQESAPPSKLTGALESFSFATPVLAPLIRCALPEFGFTQESIATRNLYLPGVQTYALNTNTGRIATSYVADRPPSTYLQQSSEQPSEVLATRYSWYERENDTFARQGLFISVSSPQAQQESAYRLFGAGALVGLAGGPLVASLQTRLEPRRDSSAQGAASTHRRPAPSSRAALDRTLRRSRAARQRSGSSGNRIS